LQLISRVIVVFGRKMVVAGLGCRNWVKWAREKVWKSAKKCEKMSKKCKKLQEIARKCRKMQESGVFAHF